MERVCPHVPAGVDTALPQGTGVGEQASMLGESLPEKVTASPAIGKASCGL